MAAAGDLPSVVAVPEHYQQETAMARTAAVIGTAITLALTSALGACASQAADTDKSGGAARPLVLSIGTPDHEGQPGAAHVKAFVEKVAELSDGLIEVRPQWEVSGESDDWDQRAARKVAAGDLDLGLIPARTWDTEGVDTLRPLQAPFLLISEEAADATLSSDVVGEMLAGLEPVGVTGLALFPEAFRYLYAFGEPARTLADLRVRGSRTPWSHTTFATHEALGMSPDDPNGPPFAQAILDGEVEVVEGSFAATPGADVATTTAIGNLPLFVKVNSLVAHTGTWEKLAEEDRETLVRAAAAVQEETTGLDLTESQVALAREYCTSHAVVSWDSQEVAAAHAAVQPVYAELEADARTAELLDEVRRIAHEAGGEPAVVPECSPGSPSPEVSPSTGAGAGDQTVLDGTYRYTITADYLRDRGATDHEVAINSGVLTWTLDNGEYEINWRSPEEPAVERGTYTVDGDRVTFYLSWVPVAGSPQGAPYPVDWEAGSGGDLTFTLAKVGHPLLDALFVAAPWKRLE
jgi:TRAP-type C4-dicarboxylate transport system substrate-binding protein